jgi:uncharacterized protein
MRRTFLYPTCMQTSLRGRALLRVTVFLIVGALAWMAPGPIVGLVGGLFGHTAARGPGVAVALVLPSLILVVANWVALRREGESLADVGLTLDARRAREFALGFLVSAGLFAAVPLARAIAVGATWELRGRDGLQAAIVGLPVAFLLMFPEELIFRGYAFRRLIDVCGTRAAVVASALLFGVYHLAQSGFGYRGIGAFWVVAMPALGGILFGLAMVRTRGLALPVGLHLGGNWVQASVLRFEGQAGAEVASLVGAPLTMPQIQRLFSPDLPSHVPYMIAVAVATLLVVLWPRANGRAARPAGAVA